MQETLVRRDLDAIFSEHLPQLHFDSKKHINHVEAGRECAEEVKIMNKMRRLNTQQEVKGHATDPTRTWMGMSDLSPRLASRTCVHAADGPLRVVAGAQRAKAFARVAGQAMHHPGGRKEGGRRR